MELEEKEYMEKLMKEQKLYEEELRKMNEEKRKYAQEKEKFENLKRNNQLDIVEEKKIEENRIFIYDENVEIVKKAEIKTFKHDYIQKKYKIKNTVFPTRKTITKILGIQTQENNIQINQNYIQQIDGACPGCGRVLGENIQNLEQNLVQIDNNVCPNCQQMTTEHIQENQNMEQAEYQKEEICPNCMAVESENNVNMGMNEENMEQIETENCVECKNDVCPKCNKMMVEHC